MSQRYSTVFGDHIEYSYWLIFDASGGMRMTRGTPDITRAERAVEMTASLPKALFHTPTLRATLSVSGDAVKAPAVDIQATQDALRSILGVEIDLTVTSQEQPT